jgi:hypothetical protein
MKLKCEINRNINGRNKSKYSKLSINVSSYDLCLKYKNNIFPSKTELSSVYKKYIKFATEEC